MQIISGLRRAGHRVTFSMPLDNYLGQKNIDRVLPLLSKEELWASEHYFEQDVVLNRIQPDISITCNVNTFRHPPRFAKEVIQILDLYGPLQFEALLLDNPDYEAAMHDPARLEERCSNIVRSFRSVDYIVTVSERQKYFWSAYCSLAGFSFVDLNLVVCPAVFDIPPVHRNPSPKLSVVYAGGFYPWQNPNRFLEQAASILDSIDGATLHIFGGPHQGLANEADARAFLEQLQQHRSVQYHGYRPVEEVLATLSQAWCALELMERNIERELAITGRTVEYLSTGTPVIYNDYSTLSRLIKQYGAGWTLSVEGEPPLHVVFEELTARGLPLVEERSNNAKRLAAQEFSAENAIAPLAKLCGSSELSKRISQVNWHVPRASGSTNTGNARSRSLGRVLTITPDAGTLLDLRVRNPLRALHRQKLIDGVTFSGCPLNELQHDYNTYDVIVTQRAIEPLLYDLLENLSLKFLLDVDDNLLARAAYRTEEPEFDIATGLRLCTTVTMPTARLLRALERYTGLPLASKAFIAPNALPFTQKSADRPAQPPSQIIWIQSDIAALDRSRDNIVFAVEKFSNKHELPIVLIGKNVLSRPQFRNQIVMGEIDFTANLQFLYLTPLGLGVAPLETHSDVGTLDFVAGKSDLKILLFAGYGHSGVYSAAPPYTDSNLQKGLSIVGNTAAEWQDALEYEFREGWKRMPAIARDIQAERNIDKVAKQNWYPALEAARLTRPITGAELYQAFRSRFEMGRAPSQSLAYLAANNDVLSCCMTEHDYTAWMHYEEWGRAEGRHLRHSLRAQTELMARIANESSRTVAELRKKIQALRESTEREKPATDQLQLLQLGPQNERLENHLQNLEHEKQELKQKAEELEEQRQHLAQQINQLEHENQQLKQQADDLLGENAALNNTLTGVIGSNSWRLTAPLRNLRGRVRSRPNG